MAPAPIRRRTVAAVGAAAGEPTLSVAAVAAQLQVSRMTVYRMIRAGQLAAVRIDGRLRVPEALLDASLRAGGCPPSEVPGSTQRQHGA